jgi:D-aminopeptidase
MSRELLIFSLTFALVAVIPTLASTQQRTRARGLGVAPGTLRPGPLNSITDVSDVRVGQTTIIEGDSVRTGVTAIIPHGGNLFHERVPAALYVGNGFGKLVGTTQLVELGELETPILLTCTLCVWRAADALVTYLLGQPGMAEVRSINPVVGETNDGLLNNIRQRPIGFDDVRKAIAGADRSVTEGSVGAGTGTIAFGWKGGIGTSSRVVSISDGNWTVGVLVQSNFGGDLHILGIPVGRALGRDGIRERQEVRSGGGSIMIVVATDAPVSDRNLQRLAARAIIGVGRTGSVMHNGSGDYVIAFSTNAQVRRKKGSILATRELSNDAMSELFQAVVESTEEAIYNSLFMASTVTSRRGTVEAIPVYRVVEILRAHRVLTSPASPSRSP